MSEPPSEYDPSPEFGWSLPPEETPLPPPPPPVTVVPSRPAPMPPPAPPQHTGFGGPPGAYIAGPVTASTVDTSPPTPTPGPGPKPLWQQWWFIAAVLIVLVGGGALILSLGGSSDEQASGDSRDTAVDDTAVDDTAVDDTEVDDTATDVTSVETTSPDITDPGSTIAEIPGFTVPEIPDITLPESPGSTPPVGDLAVIGQTVALDDGTTIRVDTVTHDASPAQDFFPVDDGNVLTRIEFEACSGTNGFSALNPLYWDGTLADGTQVESFLFSFPIVVLQLAPGGCVRSQVDLQAPADALVATVGVRNSLFQTAAEWSTASSVNFEGPLVAANPVAAAPVGSPVSLANGGSATIRAVTAGAEPLDPSFPADSGYQYVQIDVEICAGSAPSAITAANFFGVTTDNRIGAASSYNSTLPTGEIAAGQCANGLIDLAIPDSGTILDVVMSDEQFTETARWRAA